MCLLLQHETEYKTILKRSYSYVWVKVTFWEDAKTAASGFLREEVNSHLKIQLVSVH